MRTTESQVWAMSHWRENYSRNEDFTPCLAWSPKSHNTSEPPKNIYTLVTPSLECFYVVIIAMEGCCYVRTYICKYSANHKQVETPLHRHWKQGGQGGHGFPAVWKWGGGAMWAMAFTI